MIAAVCVLTASLVLGGAGDVTRFRPPPVPGELLGTAGTTTLAPWQYAAGLTLSYARNPLVWRYPDDTYEPVIVSALVADIGVALGLASRLDVGASLPVALRQNGATTSLSGLPSERRSFTGAGLGDLRLMARVNLTEARSIGVGLALSAELGVPTGDSGRLRGDGAVGVTPRLHATLPLALGTTPLELTGSAGYRLRRRTEMAALTIDDELAWSVGAQVPLRGVVPLTALGEIQGASAARRPFSGDGLLAAEALVGLRARLGPVLVTVAGGVGLTQGLGTPDFRVVTALGYAPEPLDTDHDGIPDVADGCPTIPEDRDGCPDDDNDRDEIADREDRCPDEPEDKNGERDDDGCPDEGVTDTDGDGIYDDRDECVNEPENVNGLNDDDGCPDADTDRDGIADDRDRCPREKETINGVDDWDGCPDLGEGQTEYVPNVKIDIKATIHFETGKATIKQESETLLDQVALQILAHPEVRRVRIEGHTDSVGPDDENLYLSQDRADSVRRYLIGRGVAKDRLTAVGFGETRPLGSNETARGRTLNRRVEFVIIE